MELSKLQCGKCKREIQFYQLNWIDLDDIPLLVKMPLNVDEATRKGIVECFSCGYHKDISNTSNRDIRTV